MMFGADLPWSCSDLDHHIKTCMLSGQPLPAHPLDELKGLPADTAFVCPVCGEVFLYREFMCSKDKHAGASCDTHFRTHALPRLPQRGEAIEAAPIAVEVGV